MSYRGTRPKITWGAAFGNTLNFGYPVDNVTAGPEPRAGSSTDQAPSGVEDAWTVGIDYMLTADFRWIPQVNTAVPLASGWDGASGVAAWLTWARDKNPYRFYPDATSGTFITCYLVQPMSGQGQPEADGTRSLTISQRNILTPFDGY